MVSGLDRFRGAAAFVGCATAVFMLAPASAPIADPDVWWLTVAGEEILRTLRVPSVNAYSYTAPSHPWLMHEWSFGVLYALGVRLGGMGFLGLFAIVVGAASLALVFRETIARAKSPLAALSIGLAAVLLFGVRLFSARPTGMTIIFALAMATLAFAERFDKKHAAMAVALELAWTNAHGSFPLGVAILGVAALSQPRSRSLRAYAAAAALAITVVNPYGLALHRLVLDYALGSNDVYAVIHRHVLEFRPVWRSSNWVDGARLGLVAVASLIALQSREYRGRALLCLALVPLAALATRHIELAGLMTCMLLGPRLDLWLARPTRGDVEPAAARMRLALALLPGLAVGLASNTMARRARSDVDWVGDEIGGASIVSLVSALPPGTNVYAPFRSSGLVIWLGHGRGTRVFYDSRNDCYPAEVARTFFQLEHGALARETAREMLAVHDTTAAILPDGHPLSGALAGWTPTRKGEWVLWSR